MVFLSTGPWLVHENLPKGILPSAAITTGEMKNLACLV